MPLWLLTGLGAARNAAKGAVSWATANTAHLLLIALAGVFLWGWLGHHEAAKWKRAEQSSETARKADGKTWADAFGVERGSVKVLLAAIDEQNRAVAGLKATSDRQIAANHAAVQKAAERAKSVEALSARMKAALASGGADAANSGPCASDPTFLAAAKGGAL